MASHPLGRRAQVQELVPRHASRLHSDEFARSLGTACPQHPTLCPGPSEPKQCSQLRDNCTIPDRVVKANRSWCCSHRSIAGVGSALVAKSVGYEPPWHVLDTDWSEMPLVYTHSARTTKPPRLGLKGGAVQREWGVCHKG